MPQLISPGWLQANHISGFMRLVFVSIYGSKSVQLSREMLVQLALKGASLHSLYGKFLSYEKVLSLNAEISRRNRDWSKKHVELIVLYQAGDISIDHFKSARRALIDNHRIEMANIFADAIGLA